MRASSDSVGPMGAPDHLNPRFGNNFIDANFFDNAGTDEDAAVDQILKWADDFDEDLSLLLPYSVQAEIGHPIRRQR